MKPIANNIWIGFIKFILTGFINTFVGLGTTWTLIGFGDWEDFSANIAGYSIGLICSFKINRVWTFGYLGNAFPAFGRFLLVFVMAYVANILTVIWLRDYIDVDRYFAHALACIPYSVVFYLGSRFFAFVDFRRERTF